MLQDLVMMAERIAVNAGLSTNRAPGPGAGDAVGGIKGTDLRQVGALHRR